METIMLDFLGGHGRVMSPSNLLHHQRFVLCDCDCAAGHGLSIPFTLDL